MVLFVLFMCLGIAFLGSSLVILFLEPQEKCATTPKVPNYVYYAIFYADAQNFIHLLFGRLIISQRVVKIICANTCMPTLVQYI